MVNFRDSQKMNNVVSVTCHKIEDILATKLTSHVFFVVHLVRVNLYMCNCTLFIAHFAGQQHKDVPIRTFKICKHPPIL
jgi:hypothetical protein